ncbi:MAG: type II toxin-antitoxin system VapC family toxin [Burkholderiales bacterium]|nr:type II toxin-antitoxin system VapC family toxin [Burkholderiales bacterium]
MPGPGKLLVDTDVMIDFLRQRPAAAEFMRGAPLPLSLSVVTVAELFAGVREGRERALLETTLKAFSRLGIDEQAAILGGLYARDYGKSHGVELPDALIAATASLHGCRLVTLNKKHYPMLKDVLVPYAKR